MKTSNQKYSGNFRLLANFLLCALIFSACKKEGTGGDATIVAFVKHHEKSIYGATIFVKFGAKEFPGTNSSDYDLTLKSANYEDHVHIEELKWGDYYLYAVGFDSSIAQTVTGGTPITIKYSERKKEMDVTIAVKE